MSPVPRFGLIGCGAIGSRLDEETPAGRGLTHASVLMRSARAELVAVCDIDLTRAQACGGARGIGPVYSDASQMLQAERLDAVVVAAPPTSHLELVQLALDHGVRLIWCEKPLAPSLSEGRRLHQLVEESKITFALNYLRRWAPVRTWLMEAHARLGKVQGAAGWYTKGLSNNGSHLIDLIGALLGPAQSALATGVVQDGREDDPTVSCVLKFGDAGDTVPVHLVGAHHAHLSVLEVDLLGTAGRVRMFDGGRRLERLEVVPDSDFPGYRSLESVRSLSGGLCGMFDRALEQILDVFEGRAHSVEVTAADGVVVLEVVAAIRRSLETGATEPVQHSW